MYGSICVIVVSLYLGRMVFGCSWCLFLVVCLVRMWCLVVCLYLILLVVFLKCLVVFLLFFILGMMNNFVL